MKLSIRKNVVGSMLAISLGAFTLPASASVPPMHYNDSGSTKVANIQLAELARDVDEKADEVKNETNGAVNAVETAHRRHERNEYRHHTIGSKVDSKVSEVRNETVGASRAVDRAHHQHEALEHAEGRD